MQAIMISIQPQWVEKILNGEKTIEIRKTKPNCELPIKVYIYCTKNKPYLIDCREYGHLPYKYDLIDYSGAKFDENAINGKVVAEFILNKITEHPKNFIDCEGELSYNFLTEDVEKCGFKTDIDGLCDFDSFVENYGKGKPLYAWHIANLKIYDKPKELSEFKKDLDCDDYPCNKNRDCKYSYYDYSEGCWACGIDFDGTNCIYKKLTRPPQSWCYVEELEVENG